MCENMHNLNKTNLQTPQNRLRVHTCIYNMKREILQKKLSETVDKFCSFVYNTQCVSLSETMLNFFKHKQTTGDELIWRKSVSTQSKDIDFGRQEKGHKPHRFEKFSFQSHRRYDCVVHV